MRKVLIFCLILLLILSAAPFVGALVAEKNLTLDINNENVSETTPTATANINFDDDEYIISLALSLYDESFCDEAFKAALCIARNNHLYSTKNGVNPDNTGTVDNSGEIYEKVKTLNKKLNTALEYNGECVYIPASKLSGGKTETEDKYPYIKAVASPWDCLSEDFIYGKEYSVGISMYGINYLCENGLNYKEALKWYLPDFEIK